MKYIEQFFHLFDGMTGDKLLAGILIMYGIGWLLGKWIDYRTLKKYEEE